jgi:hypothetical protein
MDRTAVRRTATRDVVCGSCGRPPHPSERRLSATLAVVLPIDLLLLALLIGDGGPFIATSVLFAITTTIAVISVVEPLFMRPFGGWLHEPEPPTHRRRSDSAKLWSTRVAVGENPGVLEKLPGQLTPTDSEILSLQAHPNFRGGRNELGVSARERVLASDMFAAAHAAGTIHGQAWTITALAPVDGSSEALALGTSFSDNPLERLCEIREVPELGNRPGLSEAAFQPGTGARSIRH